MKREPAKKRFAVGAHVRIKMPGVNGVVTQGDDVPAAMGEYWHRVETEHGERREPGCNLELVPTPVGGESPANLVTRAQPVEPAYMKSPNRYSVGRHVLVGQQNRPAIVKSVSDTPTQQGEFDHDVLLDKTQEVLRVSGCDIRPFPGFDEDLRGNRPMIHIQDSNVANLNMGSQIGTINAALQVISKGDESRKEFARALEEFTQAVVAATLSDANKQEVVEAVSTIAEQAAKKPEERSKGTLKALVAWIPTAISAANNLVTLWDKIGPCIKGHLGI
jgi:hypothetical protein